MEHASEKESLFIRVVARINLYLILMGIFFLGYFLVNTKVNVFLFLLSLLTISFALLSYQHLKITDRLSIELERAKTALEDVAKDMRQRHPG